jgi:hypothetical protein
MAWFTVQYRDKNGAKAEAEYEAADRSALFKMLSGRNITPVRVVDGRLAKKKGTKSGSAVRGILAGLIVVVGALAAFYFLVPSNSGSEPKQNVKKQERKPNTYGAPKPAKDSGAAVKQGKQSATRGKTAPTALPGETTAVSAETDGETPAQEDKPKPRRIFKHGTDQLIWLAVFASNGASIPPLPHMTKTDTDRFIESLGTPIEIDPDEPEHIQQMKKAVDEVRRDVAELLAKNPGEELMTVLNNHREEFNGRLNLHADAQKEYNRFLEEGDAEGAEEYRLQANELLAEYGAEPIEAETDDEESGGGDSGAGQN